MFDYLSPYSNIIVSGPQRSGTRICAQMIAADLGMAFVGEHEIYTDSMSSLIAILARPQKQVIQAPALMRWLHLFTGWDNVAFVVMRRSTEEIMASRARISWGWEPLEAAKYADIAQMDGFRDEPLPDIKYYFWDNFQKRVMKHVYDVNYNDLRGHSLWVEERTGWTAHQTAP